jgi:ABC-type dipeptide/oligopeptide/nickel transport system permease component
MKAVPPEPVHESYLRHRKQRTTQIIVPVVLAAIVFISLIVTVLVAISRGNADAGRLAAISTMWIAIPTCIIGLVFLALVVGMSYLMVQLFGIAPTYTGRAQDIVHKLAIRIRRAADMAVRPIIALNSYGATIKALLGRK